MDLREIRFDSEAEGGKNLNYPSEVLARTVYGRARNGKGNGGGGGVCA